MESRKRHRAISRCWVGHQRVLDRQTSVTSHDDLDIVRNASIIREREREELAWTYWLSVAATCEPKGRIEFGVSGYDSDSPSLITDQKLILDGVGIRSGEEMKAMDHRIQRQTDLLSVRCTVLDMMCMCVW